MNGGMAVRAKNLSLWRCLARLKDEAFLKKNLFFGGKQVHKQTPANCGLGKTKTQPVVFVKETPPSRTSP